MRAKSRYNGGGAKFSEAAITLKKSPSRADAQSSGQHSPEQVAALVKDALDDAKANDVQTIDVRGKTSITDYMIIASGNSSRHVKTLADSVVSHSKKAGLEILGVEGGSNAEWVLVDLADVLVHLMLPRTRSFYNLEGLWSLEGRAA